VDDVDDVRELMEQRMRATGIEEDLFDRLMDLLDRFDAMSAEERMRAVGPVDFLAGERKVWAQVGKGDVPGAATLMGKVLEASLAVINKGEEDLKEARNNDKVIDALLIKNFGSINDTAKGLLAKYSVTGPAPAAGAVDEGPGRQGRGQGGDSGD